MGKCPFGDRGACMRSSAGATAKPSICKGRSYLRWHVSDNASRNIPPTRDEGTWQLKGDTMKNRKWSWYDRLMYRLTGLTPIERRIRRNNEAHGRSPVEHLVGKSGLEE